MSGMRTTLTVDDGVVRALKRIADRRGVPLKAVVNDALGAGLREIENTRPSTFCRTKVRAFAVLPGLDPCKLGQIGDGVDGIAKLERGA